MTLTKEEQDANVRRIVEMAREIQRDSLKNAPIEEAIPAVDRFERAAAYLESKCDPPAPQAIRLGWSA